MCARCGNSIPLAQRWRFLKMKKLTGPIRGVLLDVDGTLVDSNHAHALAWVGALSDHGIPVSYKQVRPLIGMGGDKLLRQVGCIVSWHATCLLI
jgi:hypothetical protein